MGRTGSRLLAADSQNGPSPCRALRGDSVPPGSRAFTKENERRASMSKTILLCSNIYPPEFVGGAELIVSYHAKTLQQLGHNPIVFAGRGDPLLSHYAVSQDSVDGV